jgi:DNA-directed RNA polymerase specialized sigma subunit
MTRPAKQESEHLNSNEQTWIYVKRWFGWCWNKFRRKNHINHDDARHELWIGMFEVFRRFDPAKSSGRTYAVYALQLTRLKVSCLEHGVTREVSGLLGRVIEAEHQLTTLHERAPTAEEIALLLQANVENVRQVQLRLRHHDRSSNNRAESRGDVELKCELLSYDDEARMNLIATAALVMPRVEEILKYQERSREVLFSRACGEGLAEIGRRFDIGRERVRQISNGAARECRNGLMLERALKRKLITHDCMVPPELLLENEGV